ncbi:competence protein ComEC [Actinocatenispora thailandica]|uniref:Competence protein ComEC n=1 Tax=Actinocatenispora thailandica TaxID=227318 RepID=A0A7R7DLF7_9ACTN|nr:ComEC/Rec2 family competence protein [Actinocatenispora thailandica]BCJ33778.1 competence protein ComEC [Actinocatenispora thailandica]
MGTPSAAGRGPAEPTRAKGSSADGRSHPRRGPDLRLVGVATGCWFAVLAAIRVPPSAALAGAVVGFVAAAGVLAFAVHRKPRREAVTRTDPGRLAVVLRLLVSVLLGAGCGALSTAAHTYPAQLETLAAPIRAHRLVHADLTVAGDPHAIAGSAFGTTWLVPATLTRFAPAAGGPTVRAHVRVIGFGSQPSWRSVLPGQRVAVTARLSPPQRADGTAAVLSITEPPKRLGDPPWYQRVAARLRAGLQVACRGLPSASGGLLPGLVDGDTSRLDPIVHADFATAGMTHLTAVSGSNLAIVLGFVLLAARWARAGPRVAALVGAAATVGFVVLVRPDPSVLRAALMGGLGLLALALHRPRAAVPGLAASVFLLLLVDPALAVQLGFVLSALATLGLLLFAPAWRDALRRRRVPGGIAEVVAVSTAAHVACAPVIAGFAGTVGLLAVPANVLAEPAVAPATVLGLAAAIASPVSPTAAHALAWLADWPCRWLVLVAHGVAGAPAATLPWPVGVLGAVLLAVILVAAVVVAGHRTARRLLLVVVICVVAGAAPVRWLAGGWPPDRWVFVACDVGQGDGLVLRAAPGQAVVVDAGPEPTAIDGCLRRLGIRSVPLLVFTHDDADHVGGVAGVFDGRQVGAVGVSRFRGTNGGRARVERAAGAHGLRPFPVPPGWRYRAGGLALTALGPPEPMTGTESDTNNNCVVLRAVAGSVSILLTGDAGPELQQELRVDGAPLHADVLKVPHHGSVHQDPDFVAAVGPKVAVVSVGVDNDYGHPNPGLLARITAAGIRVVRTDRDGDVAVVDTGRGLAVARRGPPPGRAPPSARALPPAVTRPARRSPRRRGPGCRRGTGYRTIAALRGFGAARRRRAGTRAGATRPGVVPVGVAVCRAVSTLVAPRRATWPGAAKGGGVRRHGWRGSSDAA